MAKKAIKKAKSSPVVETKNEEVIELGIDFVGDIFAENQVAPIKEQKSSVIELGIPEPERIVIKPKPIAKPVAKKPEPVKTETVKIQEEVKQTKIPEPAVKTEDKTMPTIPKFVRGQKVFLKDENMKPYIVKKQDPYNPNK